MAYRDLQAFIAALEKRGRTHADFRARLPHPGDHRNRRPRHEAGRPRPLLFERVEGSDFPLLINAMGSDARMALALGAESLDEIGGDVARYLDFGNYTSLGNLIASPLVSGASPPAFPTGAACALPARPASR